MRKQLQILLLCATTTVFAQTPVASIVSGTTPMCQGSSVTLKSSSATGNRWYRNGMPTSGIYQTYTATLPGTYTVKVNNVASNSVPVTVYSLPSANISPAGTNNIIKVCSGSSVQLTASDVGTGVTYLWNTGATTRSILVNTAGTFWVTVTNANGCSKTSVKKTTVVESLPASITATANGPTTFCAGMSVTLSASGASAYQWYRNGSKINGATSSSYVATLAGTYTVCAYNGVCYSPQSNGIKVTVNPVPNAIISPTAAINLCPGSTATLTSSSAGTGGSYLWSNGATTRSIVVSTPGTYTVTIFTNKDCERTSAPKVVTMSAAPVISADGPTRFCPGGSVTLTSTPGASYHWSTGDTTQFIKATLPGEYICEVVDQYGCRQVSNMIKIENYQGATVNAGADQLIYLGYGNQSAELQATATGSGTISYSWSTSETTQNITVSPAATTSYIVTATDENSCSAQDTVVVDVVDVRCGPHNDKVSICHHNTSGTETICVDLSAVEEHLTHGDILGACPPARLSGSGKNQANVSNISVFPNPFTGASTISYKLSKDSEVTIEVYNVLGSKVKTLRQTQQSAGEYQLSFDLKEEQVDHGVYFIKFSDGEKQSQVRVIRSRD